MGRHTLIANAPTSDAYAEADLGVEHAEAWTGLEIMFSAAAQALWTNEAAPYPLQLFDGAHGPTVDGADNLYVNAVWNSIYNSDTGWQSGGTPLPDVWQTIELRHKSDGTAAFYVDGVLVASGTANAAGVRYVRVGIAGFFADAPDNVCSYRNVRVGPTRGSGAYFSWLDTEPTLAAWTTTVGDVTVDGGPIPFALTPRSPGALTLTPATPATLTLTPA